jgi:acylphosphatase
MTRCRRCIVSGLVQGVAYRANTQREARRLGVSGYAKNLPDGRVEVLACGDDPAVDALCEWLWQGPRLAQVSEVRCAEVPLQDSRGFVTL